MRRDSGYEVFESEGDANGALANTGPLHNLCVLTGVICPLRKFSRSCAEDCAATFDLDSRYVIVGVALRGHPSVTNFSRVRMSRCNLCISLPPRSERVRLSARGSGVLQALPAADQCSGISCCCREKPSLRLHRLPARSAPS